MGYTTSIVYFVIQRALLAALPFLLFSAPMVAQDDGQAVPQVQRDGDDYILNFAEKPEDRISLEDFVKICQEATGINFTYNDTTQGQLASLKVTMFGSKTIPQWAVIGCGV